MDKLNIITVQTGKIVCGYYSALESNGCFRNQEVLVLCCCVIFDVRCSIFGPVFSETFKK